MVFNHTEHVVTKGSHKYYGRYLTASVNRLINTANDPMAIKAN
jgi:hypothetical protein